MLDPKKTAKTFAAHMDNNQFTEAKAMLHPQCIYKMRDELIKGPEAIMKTYEDNYQAGIKKLDEIVFGSEVVQVTETHFKLKYSDKLRKADKWYEFKCEQDIHIQDGLVSEIVHIDLPGEDEALQAFYKTNNVTT